MRSGPVLVVVASALVVASAGCGDGGPADKADEKPATTTVVVAETPVTEVPVGESVVGSTVTTTTTAPPPTTVTVPVGLPPDLGIPGAGNLTLGSSSSLSNAVTVRGVPLEEVVAYVRAELARLGWAVNPDLTFVGPGAVGQATVAQVGDDVEIRIVLTGPPR